MKKRYNNYDTLRIIACFVVIISHVTSIYKNSLMGTNIILDVESKNTLFVLFWHTLPRFSVPCFIMLSGALLLSDDRNKEYKYFYNKSIKKIGIPIVIFTIMYFLYIELKSILKVVITNEPIETILSPIVLLAKGNIYYHLLYIYVTIGTYLMTPLIIRFKNSISKKAFSNISWIFLVVASISFWTSDYEMQWDVGCLFEYLAYFMIGYEIKQKIDEKEKNNKKGIIFIILGITLLLCSLIPMQYNAETNEIVEKIWNYKILSHYNPIIVISSILIYVGFSYLDIKKNLSKLAGSTLYVYIFHAAILDVFIKFLKVFKLKMTNLNLFIPLLSIIIFILSYILGIFKEMIIYRIDVTN